MGNTPQGPNPRAAVRIAAFERSMEAFNAEMAQKVAQAIHAYHVAYVEPLERRLAEVDEALRTLEAVRSVDPWWRRFSRMAG